MSHPTLRPAVLLLCAAFLHATPALSQQEPSTEGMTIRVEPTTLTLEVGDKASLTASVLDKDGASQEMPVLYFSRNRRAVSVTPEGEVEAHKPGSFEVFVGTGPELYATVSVDIPFPPVSRLQFDHAPAGVYSGTAVPIRVQALDDFGPRDNVRVRLTSSNPSLATVDAFNRIEAHGIGSVTLTAEADGVRAEHVVEIVENPIVEVRLTGGPTDARTGDVIPYRAVAYDQSGNAIDDAPIVYSVVSNPADNLGPAASALIDETGRFVAETPGLYTVVASVGNRSDMNSVRIASRSVSRKIELVGKGIIGDHRTSDLWVWEGADGRDYAVTGTHSAKGEAYFWDVTDAASPTIIDTVTVDARTVNDVKVDESGTLCVISREGASSRRNGIVLLDCTDPHNVRIISEYTENLTGGVHNLFIYDNHVYALSAGQRYDVINIEDPSNPRTVGSFELDTPGHSVHDVWIEDGIAYSSNWSDGVVMVDVGNGIAGGSPSNPVLIGQYAYPTGWNHAAFPYRDKETGKFYIIAGDEASVDGKMAGWIHFIDFTDPNNPKETARYEVPEAGTHNMWVKDDTLYVAYYQGGLRVVDLKGDLMGDLYRQGREIAKYLPADADAHVPNTTMTWGPQPYKGNIFMSDFYSGLWIVKLQQEQKQEPGI